VLLIGCDYHPSVQQIARVNTETGECGERRLTHCAEAEQFYRELKQQGTSVCVGIEATGNSRWFERLLAELNFELWIGDPAQIRAKQVRKQRNDPLTGSPMPGGFRKPMIFYAVQAFGLPVFNGTSTSMVVPPFGFETIEILPFTRRVLSRMLITPMPRPLSTFSRSKPAP